MRALIPLGLAGTVLGCSGALPETEVCLVSPEGDTLSLTVEVASNPLQRAQGLQDRRHLPEGHGMIFVYPESQDLETRFWMKDTLIPLDIAFIDNAGGIVDSATMEPCLEGGACPLYQSKKAFRYAVEMNAGALEQHGISGGQVYSHDCDDENNPPM